VPIILLGSSVVVDESACQEVRRGLDHRHGLGGFTHLSRGTTGFILRPGHRGIGRVTGTILRCVVDVIGSTRTLDLVVGHGPEV
jgi:ribosomal protein S5